MNAEHHASPRLGLAAGVGAYALWGIIPLYFRLLMHLPPLEVLAHRIVWSFFLLAGLIVARRRLRDVLRAFGNRGVIIRLTASTLLIAVNWFTFIYAVSAERIVEGSLGYFISPLANVLLGVVFLGERLRPLQVASLLLAAGGVINLAVAEGGVPWIALTLAISFALYGLMRKTVAADATLGMFVETLLLTPIAALMLTWMYGSGTAQVSADMPATLTLLVLSGLVTSVPLLMFAVAARRLQMTTLGFLQYLSPTIQFLLAVLVLHEPFSQVRLVSFGFIWVAVAIYTADSLLRAYGLRREWLAPDTRPAEPQPASTQPQVSTAQPQGASAQPQGLSAQSQREPAAHEAPRGAVPCSAGTGSSG